MLCCAARRGKSQQQGEAQSETSLFARGGQLSGSETCTSPRESEDAIPPRDRVDHRVSDSSEELPSELKIVRVAPNQKRPAAPPCCPGVPSCCPAPDGPDVKRRLKKTAQSLEVMSSIPHRKKTLQTHTAVECRSTPMQTPRPGASALGMKNTFTARSKIQGGTTTNPKQQTGASRVVRPARRRTTKPFSCDACGKAFEGSGALSRHVRRMRQGLRGIRPSHEVPPGALRRQALVLPHMPQGLRGIRPSHEAPRGALLQIEVKSFCSQYSKSDHATRQRPCNYPRN